MPPTAGEDRIGTVRVPDPRVDVLSEMYRPKKTTYAQVEYFLPGVQSRSKEGKTDQNVWNAVRDCDALIHVVRNFSAYGHAGAIPLGGHHGAGPGTDALRSGGGRKTPRASRQRPPAGKRRSTRRSCPCCPDARRPSRPKPLCGICPTLATAPAAAGLCLHVGQADADPVQQRRRRRGAAATRRKPLQGKPEQVIRAKLEQEIAQMSPEEAAEFLAEFHIAESALDRVIKASYDLMGLASFFTVGDDEVKAWTVRRDTAAVEAAGVIHTDIQKGFIRAEILAYDDLMAAGSYAEARKRGTVRLEGKTYGMQDGDIANFRFNV